jgi:hypothetical protein
MFFTHTHKLGEESNGISAKLRRHHYIEFGNLPKGRTQIEDI